MKRSNAAASSVVLALSLAVTSVALPAHAQDGPAQPSSEPAPVPPSGSEAPAPTPPPAEAPAASEPAPAAPTAPAPAPAEPPKELPVLVSGAAEAPHDAAAEEPDDGALRHHQDHFLAFVGARVGKVSSAGLDPFADSDELAQFSVGLGATLMTAGNFSLAGLLLYDIGGRSGEARGVDTDLTVNRFSLGAEARYHVIRQFFVFGRVAPGAMYSIAKLEDDSVGARSLAARDWVFATDLSAGASLELSGWYKNSKKRRPSLWLTFDGGYGFAAESELTFDADGSSGPERAEPVELGPLALGGPFLRFAAVLTY